ncbi:hypothetical protein CC78DRAFT_567786 [Lojkania enalia]|uniref:Uncharacterized protein n=1 Tax=Lojkania enalia TaxID=147567 RepID=A0A9P4K9S9_9PLEO|nr:hypothetical protein CC78DRAFT_567786 [Didymosphaeria enalia]
MARTFVFFRSQARAEMQGLTNLELVVVVVRDRIQQPASVEDSRAPWTNSPKWLRPRAWQDGKEAAAETVRASCFGRYGLLAARLLPPGHTPTPPTSKFPPPALTIFFFSTAPSRQRERPSRAGAPFWHAQLRGRDRRSAWANPDLGAFVQPSTPDPPLPIRATIGFLLPIPVPYARQHIAIVCALADLCSLTGHFARYSSGSSTDEEESSGNAEMAESYRN